MAGHHPTIAPPTFYEGAPCPSAFEIWGLYGFIIPQQEDDTKAMFWGLQGRGYAYARQKLHEQVNQ